MYNKQPEQSSKLRVNKSYTGETIESKVRRILNNNEPISDGAPLIYTERKDGVLPGYDIRTDKWEIACEAQDKIYMHNMAKREERHKTPEQKEAEELAKKANEGMAKEGENPVNTRTSN